MNGDIENRGGREQHPPPKDGRNGFSAPYHVVEQSESEWTSWLVPMFVVANVAMFIIVMFINDCPKRRHPTGGSCVASFLGRFSFEPIRENPLFGPSSLTFPPNFVGPVSASMEISSTCLAVLVPTSFLLNQLVGS